MEEVKNIVDIRKIELPNNKGTLEIKASQAFLDKIRLQFMLDDNETITDEHFIMFIYGSIDNAVKKASE